MKNQKFIFTSVLLVLMTCVLTGFASTYYVDTRHGAADDGNPGTITLPWKTISHAAETAGAGDTVLIRTGQYSEFIYFDQSGNATDGPIVFAAYPGERPVIDGSGVADANNGIVLDKDYVVISGLEICNWNENGIWIENAAFFEISGCIVHDVFYGIGITDGAHDFVFNRVEVHNFSLYGFDASPSGEAICYNGTFTECSAHTGRDRDQNVDGFALGHGDQHHFTLNRCITYELFDGFDISARNTTLTSCLAYNCWNGCYKLWQDEVSLVNCIGYNATGSVVELDWDGEPGTTTLMNCTFFNGETYTIWIENAADTLKMANCILAGGDNIMLAFEQFSAQNYFGDYNLFHNDDPARAVVVGYTDELSLDQLSSGEWSNYSGQDNHSLVAQSSTDLFTDPTNGNFQLSATSPAVDQGTDENAPGNDFSGKPRPSGNEFDIGAFEFQQEIAINSKPVTRNWLESPVLHGNFPNPFNSATHINYKVPKDSHVKIVVYNLLGQQVRLLVDGFHLRGHYLIKWNGVDDCGNCAGSGIYLCAFFSGNSTQTARLLYLK